MSPKSLAIFAVVTAILCLTPKANAQQKANVDILFNGKVMTSDPQTIMIGQQVNLAYTVSGGLSVSVPKWVLDFNVVGDYLPTVDKAKPEPLPRDYQKERTLKFYWIDQGRKVVTLEYYLSNGEQGSVSATFNVMGPTDVNVTTPTKCTPNDKVEEVGKVKFFVDDRGRNWVGFGEGNEKSVGILFKASAKIPSGVRGQFVWVQIITSDDFSYFDSHNQRSYTEKATGGVDVCTEEHCGTPTVTYQYSTDPCIADSPGSQRHTGEAIDNVRRYFAANMYLMWQYLDDPNSIPVTLGSMEWYAYWDLQFVPGSPDPGWNIRNEWVQHKPFTQSIWHPVWEQKNDIVRVQ